MELAKFFNFLYKHIVVIIIIPIVTVSITYFLVRNLPNSYVSKSQISTGLVDRTNDAVVTEQTAPQQQEIDQTFSNMIQLIQSNNVLDMVAYKFILHDLKDPAPFRKPSRFLSELSAEDKRKAIIGFETRYRNRKPLTLVTPEEELLNGILGSMNYDSESLRGKLQALRVGQSDFITIEFSSEDAKLSGFGANAVAAEFITYYADRVRDADRKSVTFLSTLLQEKQKNLNDKMNQLKSYKIQNGVLNLPEQAKILYQRMIEVQSNRERTDKEIISYAGTINDINSKFTPRERKYLEATTSRVNSDILAYREQLQALTDVFIREGFDNNYKDSMDSLRSILNGKVEESVEENIFNPLAAKQDLVSQKINMETQLHIAQHSVASLLKEYKSLTSQFSRLVPFEAIIQSYERDIDIASQEYLDILDKYNLSSIQSNFSVKLKQSLFALPGTAIPSKKMLLIIISGIVGFAFVVFVLFILFFFDTTVTQPKELANASRFPVLGYIEKLHTSTTDVHSLWNWNKGGFKDQLRSIRFEISAELDSEPLLALPGAELTVANPQLLQQSYPKNTNLLSVTSFSKGEGKTFLSISLAYAFALTNKNILLIDGNFSNPTLSRSVNAEFYFEDFLLENIFETDFKRRGISVLGNKGNDASLLEITSQERLREKISHLKSSFDYIMVEIPPLEQLDKAKEWFLFTDKIAGVFQSNRKFGNKETVANDYLHALNDHKFIGWIINKVEITKPEKKKGWFKKKKHESYS
ncbi:exopolysaccharide transport family protein [Desertivirga brevis]|uniref:exopolysaccharide transport family protein n=1 Tax=Desertivirga brevis TaxID=2810310 RepID=UPI001A95C75A|nr:lipopolysaccharide biosynthesis protein [Pedobacter sp. SYSU D00873]